MMPYGAWTSNVVWSGTVWGTRVNHHLPSKPGHLERVEAWCVLLSQVLSLCLCKNFFALRDFCRFFSSFWLTRGLMPRANGVRYYVKTFRAYLHFCTIIRRKYAFHEREQNSALKYVRYEGGRNMAWYKNCKKPIEMWKLSISEFQWLEWRGPQRAFLLSFSFSPWLTHAECCDPCSRDTRSGRHSSGKLPMWLCCFLENHLPGLGPVSSSWAASPST